MAEAPSVKAHEIREEVSKFLDKLYADTEGIVYAPTYDRPNDDWQKYYFNWPAEKPQIIEHVVKNTSKVECYVSPALYKRKGSSLKENVKGSHVVWAELDGKALSGEAPPPSFWLNSSSDEHMHIYWTLDKFCPDINKIEDVNKAITSSLGADASGWDVNQVLRFPLTANHKRKVFTGPLQVNQVYTPLTISSFDTLPRPTVSLSLENFDLDKVPGNLNEMAWQKVLGEKGTELFFKPGVEQGDRSTSLMALAYYMAENDNPGWTDYEMFAVLLGADDKWGKFKNRKDRNQRLVDIIVKARQKYPASSHGLSEDTQLHFVTMTQLLEETKPVEWVIPGLLIENGSYMLAAPPGTGKTLMSLQMALSLACGRKYLKYEITEPKRVMFLSLEMPDIELLNFFDKLKLGFNPEERKLIDENFYLHAEGESIPMGTPAGQKRIEEALARVQPDGVFIDSFSHALMGDLNSDTAINEFTAWNKSMRRKYTCFFWFIHHMRKGQVGNKKPKRMDDMFGSTFIAAGITNAGLLWGTGRGVEFSVLKDRHSKKALPYNMVLNEETLWFGVDGVDGIIQAAEAATEEDEDGEEPDATNGQNFPGFN